MNLIGLSGYAQSGKDSVAKVAAEFGYKRLAFADTLREAVYRLDPLVTVYGDDLTSVREVVDEKGWEWAKAHTDQVRGYLQRMGTEVGRDLIGENVWVDATFKDVDLRGKYVVTDMRFPNEYDAVLNRDGTVARITRRGVGPANSHPSETSLDTHTFDVHFTNDGTLEEFEAQVRSYFESRD